MTRGGRRRGAGRPRTGTRKLITIRLPAAVHQAMIETLADGESVNEYGTKAITAEAARRKE